MHFSNYKRFLDDRLLLFCLGISLLLVGECFVKAERFPYTKLAIKIATRIGQWIDQLQIPEKSEDRLIQTDPGYTYDSLCGDFGSPSQH